MSTETDRDVIELKIFTPPFAFSVACTLRWLFLDENYLKVLIERQKLALKKRAFNHNKPIDRLLR